MTPCSAGAAAPAGSGGTGRRSRAAARRHDVDYQLGGVRRSRPVGIVVRDRRRAAPAATTSATSTASRPSPTSVGSGTPSRAGAAQERRPVVDSAWGEWLLDIRTPRKRQRLAAIMRRWIRGCAARGFDAVEFDNLDSFTRSRGCSRDARRSPTRGCSCASAHRAGLSAGQKNLADFDGRRVGYDFAVAEECGRYRECAAYVAHFGRRVLSIEYRRVDFRWTCARYGIAPVRGAARPRPEPSWGPAVVLSLGRAEQLDRVVPADPAQPVVAEAEGAGRPGGAGPRAARGRGRGSSGSRCRGAPGRRGRRAAAAGRRGTAPPASKNAGEHHRGVEPEVRVRLDEREELGVLRGAHVRDDDRQPRVARQQPLEVLRPGELVADRTGADVDDDRGAGVLDAARTPRRAAGRRGGTRPPGCAA